MTFAYPACAQSSPARGVSTRYNWSSSYKNFSVRRMMISRVHGPFEKLDGPINLDGQDPTRSSVYARVDAASINTRDQGRDNHLRSTEFLINREDWDLITYFRFKRNAPDTRASFRQAEPQRFI